MSEDDEDKVEEEEDVVEDKVEEIINNNNNNKKKKKKKKKIAGYKILTEDLIHNGFQFEIGDNFLQQKFDPEGECKSGGFYFCQKHNIKRWLAYKENLKFICEVYLHKDSKVVHQTDKIKTDSFILKNIMTIGSFLEQNNLVDDALSNDITIVRYLNKIKLSYALSYLTGRTEEYKNIYNKVINCKSEQFALKAIKKNINVLEVMPKNLITKKICLESVRIWPEDIQYVPEKYITGVTAPHNAEILEMCHIAIEHNPELIRFIKKSPREILLRAVQKDGLVIRYLNDFLTEELCMAAIKQNGYAINCINLATSDYYYCREAIKQNGLVINCINKSCITNELCKLAVAQNGLAIQFIKDEKYITNEVCKIAMKQNKDVYHLISGNLRCTSVLYRHFKDAVTDILVYLFLVAVFFFLSKNI